MGEHTVDLIACYWTLAGPYVFGEQDQSPWGFRERVEAAASAGYTGFGIKQADLRETLTRYSFAQMRTIFADNGIRYLELEALFGWYSAGDERSSSDADRSLLLQAASELGAHHVKAAGDFDGKPQSVERMHDEFQLLARQALAAGTLITLEPIVISSIPDIDTALQVLGESAGAGGGLMLDSWHVTRGGMSLAQIAALPTGCIGGVELDDGTLLPVGSELEDTLNRRRLCGEGEFDLHGFIAAARTAGYQGPWGVDIISAEQRARSLQDAAQLSYRAAAGVFTSPSR
ncbi:hypothetical protein D3C78_1159260 [compost metagenome]